MSATVTSVGRRPSLAAPIACGCCLAAASVYVAAQDPSDGGVFLPCPFRLATGWWCPGCGLTRATHHLFRGDLAQAFRYNAFVIVALAAILASWIGWMLAAGGIARQRDRRLPTWGYALIGVVMVAFTLARNVPLIDGLRG